MKRRVGAVAMAAGAVLAMGGCHLILGLDEYQVEEEGGASCEDKVRNGGETDVDCGGSCSVKCADFQGCQVGTDCASVVCVGGTCRPPACDDGVKNGKETGLDCGGECAGLCKNGEGCNESRECQSGVCRGGACVDYHVWSKAFGALGAYSPYFPFGYAKSDAAGNSFVAASFQGTVDFGGGPFKSSTMGSVSLYDMAIAKFDPSGGHVWSRDFGNPGAFIVASDIAVDASGNMSIVGSLQGQADFGGGQLGSANSTSVFVARFDSAGKHMWSKAFQSGTTNFRNMPVAVDGAGNTIVAGVLGGTMDFGGTPLTNIGGDIFLAKFDSSGTHVWSRRFGGTTTSDSIQASRVDVDKDGNIAFVGTLHGTVNLGGNDLKNVDEPKQDSFVAQLDPAGDHRWSKLLGGSGDQVVPALTVDGNGDVIIAGDFENWIFVDQGTLDAETPRDIFLAKLDTVGNFAWSKRFGKASVDIVGAESLDVDTNGNINLSGYFEGTIDLGGGARDGAAKYNAFVGKLDGSGGHLWSRSFGNAQYNPVIGSISAQGTDEVLLGGWFNGTINFGDHQLDSPKGFASFFLSKLRTP